MNAETLKEIELLQDIQRQNHPETPAWRFASRKIHELVEEARLDDELRRMRFYADGTRAPDATDEQDAEDRADFEVDESGRTLARDPFDSNRIAIEKEAPK